MKKFIILLTIYLASCQAMNNATPPRSGSLKGYEYAVVADVSVYRGKVKMRLFKNEGPNFNRTLINIAKLNVIDKEQIDSLTDKQKQKLLLVRYSESSDATGAIVEFYFDDYLTGKQSAYCRGASYAGFSVDGDERRAWSLAINEMIKLR